MMQEKLSLHQVERKVMERPPKHRDTDLKVETLKVGHGVVVVAALPTEHCKRLEGKIGGDGGG